MFTASIAPARHCRRAVISAGLTLLAAQAAIAATPIAVRVGTIAASDANLARAVKETLVTDLAKSDRLTLLGGGSARGGTAPAAFTITGSCLFVDETVVINLRMVNAAGNTVPGAAENVEGPREDVFRLIHALSDRFAARIAGGKAATSAKSAVPRGKNVRLASIGKVPVPAVRPPAVAEAPWSTDRSETGTREDFRSDRYTGVIIDARGLNLERSMNARIRRLDGSTIYDGAHCTPDFAIEKGVVVYARSMEAARSMDRAGRNPLVLPALDRYNQPLSGDPLLSDEDAEYLAKVAQRDGFFKKFNVVFLID